MSVTVKERVFVQIEKKLQGFTTASNNGVTFAFVERAALDRNKTHIGNAIGITETSEQYNYQTAYLLNILRIGLEFSAKIKYGGGAGTTLNLMLGEIQKAFANDPNLVEDITSAQLTEDIKYAGFEPDIDGSSDKLVFGYFEFDVYYRTNKLDPYQLM